MNIIISTKKVTKKTKSSIFPPNKSTNPDKNSDNNLKKNPKNRNFHQHIEIDTARAKGFNYYETFYKPEDRKPEKKTST